MKECHIRLFNSCPWSAYYLKERREQHGRITILRLKQGIFTILWPPWSFLRYLFLFFSLPFFAFDVKPLVGDGSMSILWAKCSFRASYRVTNCIKDSPWNTQSSLIDYYNGRIQRTQLFTNSKFKSKYPNEHHKLVQCTWISGWVNVN